MCFSPFSPPDAFILEFDKALRALFAEAQSARAFPGSEMPEATLADAERRHAAALMRVNHAGEICAQALYQGQALAERDPDIRAALAKSACEEVEHLAWTSRRIRELGGRRSLFNPFWYTCALTLGVLAGACGKKWNLGFLAETERQVEQHLDHHLDCLPSRDHRSRALLAQMKVDEIRHADTATRLGAASLPKPAKHLMRLSAKIMTCTAYRF
ncbi:MAG: 2-polyprenyl-3-methyl-6-methoxy-1,4-benzoquinone monooxygenase [Zoogloeaceae bacterium]|jgi:ubiquinone biosynthesis monooxygenase Coq7|nr:2-polyprenyl-3-methyl-6-methoxy-1,4-benzoquinone monooxygenase [Zoogloeaceae bacterium]